MKSKNIKPANNSVTYSQEIATAICERLMTGESLNRICKDSNMPDKSTVCRWLANPSFEDFRNQYARAREIQAELMADEIIDIADDSSGDEFISEDGTRRENREFVSRSKLKVDARKWVASKLLPKKYGDKLDLNHSGPETKQVFVIGDQVIEF